MASYQIPPHGARFDLNINPDYPNGGDRPLLFNPGAPTQLRWARQGVLSKCRWHNSGVFIDGTIVIGSFNPSNTPPEGKVYNKGETILTAFEGTEKKEIVAVDDCFLYGSAFKGDVLNPGDIIVEVIPITEADALLRLNKLSFEIDDHYSTLLSNADRKSLGYEKKLKEIEQKQTGIRKSRIVLLLGLIVAGACLFFNLQGVGLAACVGAVLLAFILAAIS